MDPVDQGRFTYSINPPPGWTVQVFPGTEKLPGAIVIVQSPDKEVFSLLEYISGPVSQKNAIEILSKGNFNSRFLFSKAKPPELTSAHPNSAMGSVHYLTSNGLPGRARISCLKSGGNVVVLAFGAPGEHFDSLDQSFGRVIWLFDPSAQPSTQTSPSPAHPQPQSLPAQHQPVSLPSPPKTAPHQPEVLPVPHPPAQKQQPPVAPNATPISYVKFTEPEKGTFTMEVPKGWTVKGGFNHPIPGDRRAWIQVDSPDGIRIACDPTFPQNLCHFRDQPEGQFANMAAGGQLLNLKPSAERVGDYYVDVFLSRQLGALQPQQRRPRPDMVEVLTSQFRQNGGSIDPKWQITSHEMVFSLSRDGRASVLSVLSTAAFNGEYGMSMWAFWDANVYLYIAPPQLADRAEEVRAHMKRSLQLTPNFVQIYQQDEAKISAAGRAAIGVQQNWFAQQQSVQNMQTAFGNSLVADYWRHQR